MTDEEWACAPRMSQVSVIRRALNSHKSSAATSIRLEPSAIGPLRADVAYSCDYLIGAQPRRQVSQSPAHPADDADGADGADANAGFRFE